MVVSYPIEAPAEPTFTQVKKYGEDLAKLYILERTERIKLQLNHQKLQAIFSNTPSGLVVVDENFMIQEANPAFWSLVEKSNPEMPVALKTILPHPELINHLQSSDIVKQTATELEIEFQLTNSLHRTLLINIAPLFARDYYGWVFIIHDLTERKRVEILKGEFINMAAHELNTPLTVILGFSELLKEMLDKTDDQGSAELADFVLKSGQQLKRIVDELLEFANLYNQKTSPKKITPFNIVTTIQEALKATKPLAAKDNISIDATFNQPEIHVTGNQNILREVLKRLLENGVIFNKPSGEIKVRVYSEENEVRIEIEDTGIGIPQKEIDKIFDKFYQVEGHLTRSVTGLGLGLAIAQRGIHLHGGKVIVKSQLNRGSCFTVILPKNFLEVTPDTLSEFEIPYQQTIIYGQELARSVVAERAMSLKLKHFERLRQNLLKAINENQSPENIREIVEKMGTDNQLDELICNNTSQPI